MIISKSINDLDEKTRLLAKRLIAECHEIGIEIMVTSTYRDFEAQDYMYSLGRTVKGSIVTNAKGGESKHNFRQAFDICVINGSKCDWANIDAFKKVGNLGVSFGLVWGGNFKRLKDYAHFET